MCRSACCPWEYLGGTENNWRLRDVPPGINFQRNTLSTFGSMPEACFCGWMKWFAKKLAALIFRWETGRTCITAVLMCMRHCCYFI